MSDLRHSRLAEYVLLTVGLCGLTVLTTWPHARVFASHVVSETDPFLSMWRIGWFAHAVAHGEPLLHANIFHPESFTYLLSDATFLQSALAAPALWVGAQLPAVYNTMLLLGIVSSGVAVYWLATSLDLSRPAALVAATIFSQAPYRIEHIDHLELQWSAFGLVALGSLYRVLDAPRWIHGVILGLAVWLQFLSAVYYAVFLVPILLALTIVSAGALPDVRGTVRAGVLAAIICAALTLPIARLYTNQTGRLGERAKSDIATFSATPVNYLASPAENALYGRTADWLGAGERRLFPGSVALTLAVVGLFSERRRLVVAALTVVLVAFDLSLGLNGLLYPWLLKWWPILHGLRAPARFALFVLAGIALLAGLGCDRLMGAARSTTGAALVAIIAIAVASVEYHSPQRNIARVDMDVPVYRFLQQLPEGVVLELPLPAYSGAVRIDADYMLWSTHHWRKLVNGYSGYYPPSYQNTLRRLRGLPGADAMALLREKQVRYVLVHTVFLEPEERELLANLAVCPELRLLGTYRDWQGATVVYELIPKTGA